MKFGKKERIKVAIPDNRHAFTFREAFPILEVDGTDLTDWNYVAVKEPQGKWRLHERTSGRHTGEAEPSREAVAESALRISRKVPLGFHKALIAAILRFPQKRRTHDRRTHAN